MNDFRFYFNLGWEHIISFDALDHILFIIVLAAVYSILQWRQVVILVTAFTIGHSITLALSTLNMVALPTNWVEFLIPCTIVLTAMANFFNKKIETKAVHLNYWLALFFGLVHGLGFANTLRFILASDGNFGWALFGFNVGLEAGQLVIVLLVLIMNTAAIYLLKIIQRKWVMIVSSVVFALALKLALERFP